MSAEDGRGEWVPTHFRDQDFIDVFAVEGLAYEYWLTAARMRALGKGGVLTFTEGGFEVDRTPELDALIESYDQRIAEPDCPSSLIGMDFSARPKSLFASAFAAYNVERIPASKVFPDGDLELVNDGPLNFNIGLFDS